MQATLLPFSYALSYIDMNAPDSVTSSSPSETPSPPSMGYFGRCYDRIMPQETRDRPLQGRMGYGSMDTEKRPKKPSFTIEAILGISSGLESDRQTTPRYPDADRCAQRDDTLLAPYSVPTASPRSALTAIYKENSSHKRTHSQMTGEKSTHKMSSACSNKKIKRIRTIFTPDQLEKLESAFQLSQYVVGSERLFLANALNLSEGQVKVWFQNRRIKYRKLQMELQQARLAQLREAEVADSENDQEQSSLTKEVSSSHWDDIVDERN